ncbi:MAG: sortase [Deltaproteobacteria bacterium]|nr:sortase [Deltaproteobacteria bacterium]
MSKYIELTARLIQAGKRAYGRKWSFLGFFFVVFFSSVGVLGSLDLLPEVSSVSVVAAPALTASTTTSARVEAPAPMVAELPTKIAIPAIGLSATIANPTTVDIKILDQALLKGAVRYPTSAKLGETGNVVLFGHSSYLPVVRNQAYKTFNEIQKLVAGDLVTVSSSGTAYTYRVRSVTKESANNAAIPLQVSGRVLTLATCDTFGAKSDRFVVVADFVERHSISI